MRRAAMLVVALFLSAGAVATAFGAETTVSGHLRDSFCLLTAGAHGPSHHDCAVACAKAGIPVLLEQNKTGKYFVLMPAKDKQSLPAGVLDKMEEEVTVTGNVHRKGGMTFLTVESVK